MKKEEKIEKQEEIYKNLNSLKQDLINNTNVCEQNEFNEWAKEHKSKILPEQFENSYEHDIQLNPQKYLKYMLKMNKYLEENKTKCFQFFPLRTNIVPKYIQLDTRSLIDIFVKKNKLEYYKKLNEKKNELWNKYFKANHKIFRKKNYSFDYCILTDGYCASVRLINNKYVKWQNRI